MNRAVFLDRDGVLIEDVHLLTDPRQLRLLPGVPAALRRLREAGFRLILVSNQAVVARGLASEDDVRRIHDALTGMLRDSGGPPLDGLYFCPHHPEATVEAYRLDCDCRKPRPGLLLRGAADHAVELTASFLVGDRLTDVAAGARAGCRTVLVETGRHAEPLIVTRDPIAPGLRPDHTCSGLPSAADWILDPP
ncbi:MAG: HAD family hydrolase [Verrucomicrobiae bacterium]|nr:HAD family hydrolase [Verrucomicrobiae bacterium]